MQDPEVNVKVAVRVRPLLPKEKLGGEQLCVKFPPGKNQLVVGKDRAFTFDHVFNPKISQDDVYQTCVDSLVKSCFEGYNATVFAYGQTGAGKTYTMGGGNSAMLSDDEVGIIPRAVHDMFKIKRSKPDTSFLVKVSYVEIYKEELRDLLDVDTASKDMHIREDESGNTVISGHREVVCATEDEVLYCLEHGSAARQTGSTQMNEQSSRSHSIFTVLIEMVHYMSGKFHFVDLAGSERANRTGNVGDRFKESVHINSGLLALGNVISALGDTKKKVSHIPYRDSKITRMLKDSLGGNAQTLMICCISPAVCNFDETLNALKYANRAKHIRNKPVVNRDPQSLKFEEMQSEIKALKEELQRQRTTLMTGGADMEQAIQDAGQLRNLEDQLVKLQTECSHYRMIAEEAYRQLTDIQERDILSRSQQFKLRDWLDLMEEIKNRVPSTLNKEEWNDRTVKQLQKELKVCQDELKSDEQIFVEKNEELSEMSRKIEILESDLLEKNRELEDAEKIINEHKEVMVQQQMKIGELEQATRKRKVSIAVSEPDQDGDDTAPVSGRRAFSVPPHMLKAANAGTVTSLRPPSRNIRTSPAMFSVERVMQGFRARSQLLMNQLEEHDEVLHQGFSDNEEGDDGEESGKTNKVLGQTFKAVRSVRRSHTDDEKLSMKDNKGATITKTPKGSTPRLDKESSSLDVDKLRTSTVIHKKKLKETQAKVQANTQKIRDLSINIKLKEQLIKELVKTGKDAHLMNAQYAEKVKLLEKEKEQTRTELRELQKAFQELEVKEQNESAQINKVQSDYKKKMELTKTKLSALQKKQKETEKLANLTAQNDKKVEELELSVGKMKQQQENLTKKLKEEAERKAKLEKEVQKEQQKIKELEIKNEQQEKILKIKTEEIAAVQRKLRSGGPAVALDAAQEKLDEQRKWLDGEIEKVLEERRKMELLQGDLKKREEILAKKEAIVAEKSHLEMKKLRSSQVLTKDISTVVNKLETVEKKLEEKNREMSATPVEARPKLKDEIKSLQQAQERLRRQRAVLDDKLYDGAVISPQEERRLIELDEAIEALDAAIEYKNENIRCQEEELRRSQLFTQSEDNLLNKLKSLTSTETKSLLHKYFEKVIDLRESERKKELQISEMEMKTDEQERLLKELEFALQRSAMEMDIKLTQQQQDYEQKIQLLMKQLAERAGPDTQEARIQQLEKDLFYYKKTSRDLKKKLREVLAGHLEAEGGGGGDTADSVSNSLHTARENGSESHRSSKPGTPHTPHGIPASARGQHTHRESTPRSSRQPTPSRPSTGTSHNEVSSSRMSQLKGVEGSRQGTPVKISRRDLRPMSEAEVEMRRSNATQASVQDSLDTGKNPWS
ncbi:kinesin-like protein KIF27 isoform X2 [Lingula anatina]|uniref:Kinesin-like protein KIF27 isoform X2 n=1 Tax=Lingula anatina TaxID=7574 RepID=A0A1S3JL31_LINAN|nr:kinesin-like protein KIF27 isoform X2 [Lingula anatina]|eukprot:XP_013410614.1 kinesin-like protein KIF27 isoform X2 [Lingula anatina]